MIKIISDFFSNIQNNFILNSVIPGSPVSPGSVTYTGAESWVYYLFGALFIVFAIVTLVFSFRFRDTRAFEHLYPSYGQFKRFWYKNRFGFMVILTVIFVLVAVFFFMFNSYFLNK